MSNPLRLAMVASLDTKGVTAGSADIRRELAATGQSAAQTAASTRLLAAANDEAAQAQRRAMDAARGRSAAETELRTAIDQLTGVRPVLDDNSRRTADIAAYGAALDDLRAKHNPMFAVQRQYEQNLAGISQALRIGAISQAEHAAAVTRTEAAYRLQQAAIAANDVSMARAMQALRGRVAEETELQASIGQLTGIRPVLDDNGQRVADIEAYGAALDDLRAKHNPMFAVQRQYEQNLAAIDQALKVGAISQAEHAAAVTRAEAAYRLQQAAVVANDVSVIRAGQSTKLTASEIQNLSWQLNDIAMMLMSGQSFGIIMAQQGMQVAQIFGPRGLGTIIPAVGAGIVSLVNPTTLALAAITALGYGASYVFEAMQGDIAEADGALKDHLDLIDSVARRWAGALPGLQAYNEELRKTKDIEEALKALGMAAREQYEPAAKQLPALQIDMADVLSQLDAGGVAVTKRAELQREFGELQAGIADGTATGQDAIDVQRVLGEIADANLPKMREYADVFRDYAAAVERSNEAAGEFRLLPNGDTLVRKNPATGEQRTSILSPLNVLDGFNRTPFQTEEEIMVERSRRQQEEAENRRLGALAPTPTLRPNREDSLPSGRDFIRSQQEQIEILRAEAGAAHQSQQARERLVAALETEQEIRRLGIDMWGQEAEQMRANTAALSDLIAMRQRAELRGDLQFEREQLWRSPQEQEIAQRLRGTGLGLDSDEAGQMRDTQRLQDGIDIGDDLISGITGVVRSGSGDIGEALLQSVLDTLRNVGADMLEDGLRSLWRSLLKSVTSAGGGDDNIVTAAVGSAAKLLTGGGGGDPWAGKREAGGGAGAAPAGSVGSFTKAADGVFSTVGNYRSGVDQRLTEILTVAAERSGMRVDAFSGFRAGDPRYHGQGLATDVRLFDNAGRAIPNYQSASGFRSYEQFAQTARQVQMERFPELASDFRWGGYFSGGRGKYGAMDAMHFDLAGRRVGMGGGSWEGGLSAQQRALWPGAESIGMSAQEASRQIDRMTTGATEVTAGLGDVSKGLGTAAGEVGQFGKTLANFFPAAPSGGGGIGGWLSKLFGGGPSLDFMNSISPAATQVILGGGMTGLFAEGAAFLAGAVIPFASGEVFDKPTLFPMPQGRTGMMGEAGPEAIIPLARGRDGKLGVSVFGPGLMAETVLPLARGGDGKLGVGSGDAGPGAMPGVMPFAAGEVFDKGGLFPLPMGIRGTPGEAGPEEAIMPLSRGRDGKLGVTMSSAERAPVPMMAGRAAPGAGAAGQARGEMVVRLVMPAGWRHEIVSEAREGAAEDTVRIVADYDDGMPDRVAEITNGSKWQR